MHSTRMYGARQAAEGSASPAAETFNRTRDADRLRNVLRESGPCTDESRADAHSASEGNSHSKTMRFLRCTLLTVADLNRALADVPLRWKCLSSDKDKGIGKRIENSLFLNFVVNSWLGATGLRSGDIDLEPTSIMKYYFAYIGAVDGFIDAPENRNDLTGFRGDGEVRGFRRRFFESIQCLDEDKQRSIRRLFTEDTGVMMSAIVKYGKIDSLEDAEALRIGTSGVVVRTHIRLLDIIYGVPEERAKVIEDAYLNLGMEAQVHDDLLDLKEDMENGIDENLVYQILLKNPDEMRRVRKLLETRKQIWYGRLVEQAPASAAEVKGLQDKYIGRIPAELLKRLESTVFIRELKYWTI